MCPLIAESHASRSIHPHPCVSPGPGFQGALLSFSIPGSHQPLPPLSDASVSPLPSQLPKPVRPSSSESQRGPSGALQFILPTPPSPDALPLPPPRLYLPWHSPYPAPNSPAGHLSRPTMRSIVARRRLETQPKGQWG